MARSFNILAISSWYPTNKNPGFGIFVKRHLLEIAKSNKVDVLYFDHFSNISKGESRYSANFQEGLFEHVIKVGGFGGLPFSILRTYIWYIKLIVLGRLGKHDITHLHVPYHIGIILAPFLLLSNRPLVVSEHWSGYFNEDGRFKGLSITFRVLLRALFFKSKIITVVSRSLADSLSQLFQIGHKIIVVPNVFSKHITVRSLDAIQDGSFLMVANFNNSEKNITGAIDAFWLLYKKYPHIRLKIVGTGPDFEFIRDYKNRLGLTDDVCELTGFVNQTELSQYYHTASCYIMNSNFETFSISTLDALLHGVPVISTKCKGPESFVNASNGLLIEVGNVQQLQSAMEHMITCYTQYHPVSVKSSIPGELLQDIDVAFSNVYKNVVR